MAGKRRISGAAPLALAALVWATTLVAASGPPPQAVRAASGAAVRSGPLFEPSSSCIACHNNVITPKGEDISFGADWRGSMMANSSYDPYWLAAVRREVMDHPQAAAEIEDECSICHMPMTTVAARAGGKRGRIFSLMTARGGPADPLAAEGVSCTVCHQITAARFGERESFTGGYVIDVEPRTPLRPVFGPFAIDAGRSTMMHSASGFRPTESTHVQRSELCATCHTLFTRPLAPGAAAGLQMPEQTPYLEWRASVYRDTRASRATCRKSASRRRFPRCCRSREATSRGTSSAAATSSCCGC
ncbi:MAG TPA: hypothetical protein VFO19_04830 [Vicinamibacterales bacterium]|nr:hypothetical protein [Vicinamibacterales bacterium]